MQDGTQNFHERFHAAENELEARAATIDPPACPTWCEQPAGHPYAAEFTDFHEAGGEFVVGIGFCRHHSARVSAYVMIVAEEHMRAVDGTVTVDPAAVTVSAEVSDVELAPAVAYDLGDDLNSAARRCENLRAASATDAGAQS